MPTASAAFGKMPALGDFFRIRADAGFVSVWDEWLQDVMLSGRAALGPRWEECYLTAPVWRFCLPAGLAGPSAVIGVLMPSIDRVGRHFPLTLMIGLPQRPDRTPFQSHFAQVAALDAMEALALDALDDTMTRDVLDARLGGISAVPDPERGIPRRGAGGSILMSGGPAALLAADLAAATLAPGRACVWSCTVDGLARFMTTTGLPRGPDALSLFDLDAASWVEPAL